MADYIVCCAATEGSIYAGFESIQRERLGNMLFWVSLPDRGSWAENTKIKPDAIRAAFKVCPVVLWMDADCTISPPDDIPAGDWHIGTIHNDHQGHNIKISAGFILFRDCHETRSFLDDWQARSVMAEKDHPALKHAIRHKPESLRIADVTHWLAGRHTINTLSPERGTYGAEA